MREKFSSCYCVLGKTADDVVFSEPMNGGCLPQAEAEIRRLLPRIERGIFRPPGSTKDWKWDYEDWLAPSPEEAVDEAWIADQEERIGG